MEYIYKIERVEGDYAFLRRESDGEELFIALALLPPGCDVGDRLKQENLEFSVLN